MKGRKLVIAASVVGVLVLIVLVLPFLVNVDEFRPAIEDQLRASLGRQLHIGHLELSLLRGGITARDISIADDPAFSDGPFVRAQSLDVGLELMPLIFSRALHITSITLERPQVTLLHSPSGRWNFSSLGNSQAVTRQPATARTPVKTAAQTSQSSPPDFSVQKLQISNGRITIGSRRQQQTYTDVNLTARTIAYNSIIPFSLQAKAPNGGRVSMEGKAGPIDRQDTSLTPFQAKVAVSHLDLASAGLVDPNSGIGGLLEYNGTLQSDGRVVRSSGTAKADRLKLVKAGSPARQPISVDYVSDYDLKRQAGTLGKGAIHTGKSTALLSGTYQSQGDSTVVHMKLNGQNLPVQDLEGLLPAIGVVLPAGASLQGGTMTANLSLDGPVDRLVTSGDMNLANARLSGFNLASRMSALSSLAGMKSSGADTLIQTLSSKLRISPEGIRADDLNLIVPGLGTLTGAGTVAGNNALNFRMLAKLNSGAVSAIPALAALGGRAQQGIPFLIQGSTANPVFLPDVGGMLKNSLAIPGANLNQQQTPQGLGDILGGFLGKKKQ